MESSPLTLADSVALVLLEGGPLAVRASPPRNGAVAEPLPALEAGAATPTRTALCPRGPLGPAAGHWKNRKRRRVK